MPVRTDSPSGTRSSPRPASPATARALRAIRAYEALKPAPEPTNFLTRSHISPQTALDRALGYGLGVKPSSVARALAHPLRAVQHGEAFASASRKAAHEPAGIVQLGTALGEQAAANFPRDLHGELFVHGTQQPHTRINPAKFNRQGLYGKGRYMGQYGPMSKPHSFTGIAPDTTAPGGFKVMPGSAKNTNAVHRFSFTSEQQAKRFAKHLIEQRGWVTDGEPPVTKGESWDVLPSVGGHKAVRRAVDAPPDAHGPLVEPGPIMPAVVGKTTSDEEYRRNVRSGVDWAARYKEARAAYERSHAPGDKRMMDKTVKHVDKYREVMPGMAHGWNQMLHGTIAPTVESKPIRMVPGAGHELWHVRLRPPAAPALQLDTPAQGLRLFDATHGTPVDASQAVRGGTLLHYAQLDKGEGAKLADIFERQAKAALPGGRLPHDALGMLRFGQLDAGGNTTMFLTGLEAMHHVREAGGRLSAQISSLVGKHGYSSQLARALGHDTKNWDESANRAYDPRVARLINQARKRVPTIDSVLREAGYHGVIHGEPGNHEVVIFDAHNVLPYLSKANKPLQQKIAVKRARGRAQVIRSIETNGNYPIRQVLADAKKNPDKHYEIPIGSTHEPETLFVTNGGKRFHYQPNPDRAAHEINADEFLARLHRSAFPPPHEAAFHQLEGETYTGQEPSLDLGEFGRIALRPAHVGEHVYWPGSQHLDSLPAAARERVISKAMRRELMLRAGKIAADRAAGKVTSRPLPPPSMGRIEQAFRNSDEAVVHPRINELNPDWQTEAFAHDRNGLPIEMYPKPPSAAEFLPPGLLTKLIRGKGDGTPQRAQELIDAVDEVLAQTWKRRRDDRIFAPHQFYPRMPAHKGAPSFGGLAPDMNEHAFRAQTKTDRKLGITPKPREDYKGRPPWLLHPGLQRLIFEARRHRGS